MNAQHNEMTMDEMDQVNGGVVLLVIVALKPSTTRKEHGSPFQVEIHSPKKRPIPSANPRKRPIWQ